MEHSASEKYTTSTASSNKNLKNRRNLSESDSENEAADFSRFIVIESLEDVCQAKLSLFLIEKFISTRTTLKTVKKNRNWNLLVEVDSRKPIKSENLLYNEMTSLPTWDSTLPKYLIVRFQ